jgi:transposase InsO family protein
MLERLKKLLGISPFPRMSLLVRRGRGGHEEFWRFLCVDKEHAFVLKMSDKPPKNSRMPEAWSREDVMRMKDSGILRQVDERFIPAWMAGPMTDEQTLEFAYKKDLLNELIAEVGDAIITDKSLRSRVLNNAYRGGTQVSQMMTWLTRRWYYAEHENALSTNNAGKGGKDVPKRVTEVKKGRPNSNVVLNPSTPYKGVNFKNKWRKIFTDILYEQFCTRNLDMPLALDVLYLRAVGFYKKGDEVLSRPIHPRKLPERSYLLRWGHRVFKTIAAQQAKLGEKEWEQRKRARRGNAEDIARNIIDVFDIDGMEFNGFIRFGKRKIDVGKPVVMLAVDRRSRAVVGFYVYLGRENGTAYRKCIFSAFTRKEEVLIKYGMSHLKGFVHGTAQAVFLDRGPGIGDGQKDAICKRLRLARLMAMPGRGDAKGVVENVNGRFERRLADMKGFYKRGGSQRDEWKQKLASANSTLEFRQFMQLLLAAISEYNLGADASHLVSAKKFGGKTKPNPYDIFLANNARKRGDGAQEWPEELVYTHLLDTYYRTAPKGVVRVGSARYTSSALQQYADEWEAARRPGEPSAPVKVFGFSETKQYLLWKHTDGVLRLLQATQQTSANVGDATDWLHSFINRVKQAELRVQRIQNTAAGVLSRQKEMVIADADGVAQATNSAGRRANRKVAHEELQTEEFAEGAVRAGVPVSEVAAAVENLQRDQERKPLADAVTASVSKVELAEVVDTDFD